MAPDFQGERQAPDLDEDREDVGPDTLAAEFDEDDEDTSVDLDAETPDDEDDDLNENGDDVGAFAQGGGDFRGSEVSPQGGVDADIGDGDVIGPGDLGEGL